MNDLSRNADRIPFAGPPERRLFKRTPKPEASAPTGSHPTVSGGAKVPVFDALITYALAAIGLWISYTALADLALRAGLGHWQAAAWPLIVDGLILVATRSVFTFGEHPAKRYAWRLLIAAAAVSIAGNAAHILLPPGKVHPFIALGVGIVPPVVTLAVTHLVMVRARVRREQDAAAAAASAAVAGMPRNTAGITSDEVHDDFEPASSPAGDAVIGRPIDTRESMMPTDDSVAVAQVLAHGADPALAETELRNAIADPAPVETEVRNVIAPVAAPSAVAEDVDLGEGPEQTVEALLRFIDQAPELDDDVRETARLKIVRGLSFAAIAKKTDAKAPSTAMRRYRKAEEAALNAGFKIPPLPDTSENVVEDDQHSRRDEAMALVAQ